MVASCAAFALGSRGALPHPARVARDGYRRPDLSFQFNVLHFRTDAAAGNDRGWIVQAKVQFNR